MTRTTRSDPRGITLVEVVVVLTIACTALCAIAPMVARIRVASQSEVGTANIKRLIAAQLDYAADHDQFYAGPHSSGLDAIEHYGSNLLFDTTPSTPTTSHDWISPILGDELGLSPNRAERTWEIFELIACPRATHTSVVYTGAGSTDAAQFTAIQNTRHFQQVSYLSPSAFHYVNESSTWVPRPGFPPNRVIKNFADPFATPVDFIPRLDRIGAPANKALVADGTRYPAIGFGGLTLDFDISPRPAVYGSFLSVGPSMHQGVEYGRQYGALIYDQNIKLSMRYPEAASPYGRAMHIGRFDGSVSYITAEQAWSDPIPWYPTGSVYTGTKATPEIRDAYLPGDVLP